MSTIENYEKIAGNLKIETRPFIDGIILDRLVLVQVEVL